MAVGTDLKAAMPLPVNKTNQLQCCTTLLSSSPQKHPFPFHCHVPLPITINPLLLILSPQGAKLNLQETPHSPPVLLPPQRTSQLHQNRLAGHIYLILSNITI